MDVGAHYTNMLLSYDFSKSCTTCLVSARLNAIDIDDITERLSFSFQARNASENEESKTDPFYLYRVIMARFMENLVFRSNQVTGYLINYTNDTLDYLESPDQLKDRTVDIYRQGNSLRNLVRSIGFFDSSLKTISVDSSWLFEKLGAACTVSQAVSAKEDLDYLRANIDQLRIEIAYADSVRDDMLTLVRPPVRLDISLRFADTHAGKQPRRSGPQPLKYCHSKRNPERQCFDEDHRRAYHALPTSHLHCYSIWHVIFRIFRPQSFRFRPTVGLCRYSCSDYAVDIHHLVGLDSRYRPIHQF